MRGFDSQSSDWDYARPYKVAGSLWRREVIEDQGAKYASKPYAGKEQPQCQRCVSKAMHLWQLRKIDLQDVIRPPNYCSTGLQQAQA